VKFDTSSLSDPSLQIRDISRQLRAILYTDFPEMLVSSPTGGRINHGNYGRP
jgi:hypothetical protein